MQNRLAPGCMRGAVTIATNVCKFARERQATSLFSAKDWHFMGNANSKQDGAVAALDASRDAVPVDQPVTKAPAPVDYLEPEAEPLLCNTCMSPFVPEDLYQCNRPCSYRQCRSCIVRTGGYVCPNPECLLLHYRCPQCKADGGGFASLSLACDTFSKQDALLALKHHREIARDKIETVLRLTHNIRMLVESIEEMFSDSMFPRAGAETPNTRNDYVVQAVRYIQANLEEMNCF